MIRVRAFLRAARRDERGQALILFAAALIPMLGIAALVLDVGQLYVKQRELRNAADAAALAGSALLPGATAAQRAAAITLAEEYAELNGADPADLNIIVVTRDYPYDTIRGDATGDRGLHLRSRVRDGHGRRRGRGCRPGRLADGGRWRDALGGRGAGQRIRVRR